MNRDELYKAILAARPGGDDVVYIERRGEDYAWRRMLQDTTVYAPAHENLPDVWIFYAGQWPANDGAPDLWRQFFDDLIEETESMAGGMDRCRWPFDQPWPDRH